MDSVAQLPPVFVLHVYPRGMIITRDPAVVEKHRDEDLLDYGERDPRSYANVTPMYVQPQSTAMDFINTHRLAELLVMPHRSHAHYLSECNSACGPLCRVEIAGWIQKLLGKDVAGVVGEYLAGNGWPGQTPFLDYFELLRAEYCVGHIYYEPTFTLDCQCYVCR